MKSGAVRHVAMAPVLIPLTAVQKASLSGERMTRRRWVNAFYVLHVEPCQLEWAGAVVRVQEGPSGRDYYVAESPEEIAAYFGGAPVPGDAEASAGVAS